MPAIIPLPHGLALAIADPTAAKTPYATSRLQRGLLLLDGDQPLCQEAVGFGVPVLKRGLQAVFPGEASFDVHKDGPAHLIHATFRLNRVERLANASAHPVGSPALYAVKDLLAATIRRIPFTRRLLTAASSQLRRVFAWETSYEDAGFEIPVGVRAVIDSQSGRLQFEIDCGGLPDDVTEVVLMHEQGARFFDRYADSSGLELRGDRIGCWDQVRAAEAWFESTKCRVSLRLRQVDGATLFRGRELVGSRLAWAGFGYSFPPSVHHIHHEMTISRLA